MSSIHDFTVRAADGSPVALAEYAGRVVLIVNVASKCGYTPQYEGLEAMYEEFSGQGLDILGFPCNQFAGQEPGAAAEIQEFCTLTYGVTFPVLAKVDVNGDNADPLFTYLRAQDPGEFAPTGEGGLRLLDYLRKSNPESLDGDDVRWNFTKFLVGRDGAVIRRYETYVTPDEMRTDLDELLAHMPEAAFAAESSR